MAQFADSTGSVIPNVAITATESNTNTTYHAVTNGQGSFNLPQVAVGSYTVAATAKDFETQQQTGVQVSINSNSAVRITLAAGSATQTVTVEANAPSLDTTSSEIGGNISSRQVIDLPLSLGGVGALRSPRGLRVPCPGHRRPRHRRQLQRHLHPENQRRPELRRRRAARRCFRVASRQWLYLR